MERIVINPSADQSISRHHPINRRSHHQSVPAGFGGGILHAPPRSFSFSYPPPPHVYHLNPPPPPPSAPQQQPPLLPLPTHKLNNNNPRNRGLSCPPPPVNPKRRSGRKAFVSPKKADLKPAGQGKPTGPDPKELPRDVQGILDSGLLTDLSPPPSSLPLPTFFLRPKVSCKVEAAGVNSGATDDLRRLLRLR